MPSIIAKCRLLVISFRMSESPPPEFQKQQRRAVEGEQVRAGFEDRQTPIEFMDSPSMFPINLTSACANELSLDQIRHKFCILASRHPPVCPDSRL